MSNTKSFSITLPDSMAQMVKDKVASGAYADESEVIREGLRTLQARDAAVEQWMRDEVVPTFDRVASGQEKLIPASEVFSGLQSRYRARKAKEAV